MKKSVKITWISVGAVILLMGLITAFAPRSQTAIGYAVSQSDCNDRMKNQWCAEGYSCTACQKYTLPFYLQFPSGSTNIAWTSDCVYGTTPQDSAHTACQVASNIISHAKNHCYSGDVYWYNSIGTREGIKQDCSSGCTDITLDSAKCNDAPTPTPTGTKVCMLGTNYLCSNAFLVSGAWYCDVNDKTYCAYGCDNGACKAQSCTNSCDTLGYVECESTTSRRICGVYNDAPCLSWKTGYGCANNQVCSNGQCITQPAPMPTPTPTPSPTPAPQCLNPGLTTCISKYTYQKCNLDGTLGDLQQCGDGTSCNNGVCTHIPVTAPPVVADPCANVKCPDYCDASSGLHSQGSCSLGECIYNKGELNSPSCINSNTPESKNGNTAFWIGMGMVLLGGIVATIFIIKKK